MAPILQDPATTSPALTTDQSDEVNLLADALDTSLVVTPVYALRTGAITKLTDQWPKAAHQQQQGQTDIHRVTKKHRKRTGKPSAYVVFRGKKHGVYTNYEDVMAQIKGQAGVLHESYPTESQANAAYEYACRRNDIVKITVPCHMSVAPVCTSVVVQDPEVPLYTDDTPLRSDSWHVVYTGTQPGVYRSYVEAALHCIHIPGAVNKKFDTLDKAKADYLQSCQ
ncbi:hypothetical protein BDZ89DRAFT_337655 [Hymenopellis radicata]|nr:hypothetical protein BDZ89DRAFT_337655 [Hymenopellis radicata]